MTSEVSISGASDEDLSSTSLCWRPLVIEGVKHEREYTSESLSANQDLRGSSTAE